MNNNEKEFLVQKIRTQYTEKEHTQLDELKELDAKVKKPANIFAYIFGSISAIIMGSGMSLVMTDLGSMIGVNEAMVPGIVIGVVGMIPILGWIVAPALGIANFVFMIMGIVSACKDEEKPLPLIGGIKILK